jgi:hypothetical protein
VRVRRLFLGAVAWLLAPLPAFATESPSARADGPKGAVTEAALAARFHQDRAAAAVAAQLYARYGITVGTIAEHDMDGGYRGILHLVPALPIAAERRHLEWLASAARDYDELFTGLGAPMPFRWRDISVLMFRSVRARTPSAYAHDWEIAYNLAGSLNTSAAAVRETMFHEIFHLNDEAHGGWSTTALTRIFDSVVAKCGTKIACLSPYAPNDTIVRGGTYYAFQPGNGVGEYAAELAVRYYREQRAIQRKLPRPPPFKCGPSENARAWKLIVEEFFGGIDRTPACG